jgi:hypothetical protein
MSTQHFRKYIDIINENSQANTQLDEGIMDSLKSMVPKAMKLLGGDTVEKIVQQVKQATGGDTTPSRENAIRVAKALGFEELLQAKAKEGQPAESVVEAWGLASNWQGKLVQFLYTAGLIGAFAGANANWGTVLGSWLAIVGTLLLMFLDTHYSTDTGMVGGMGKHGRKGFDTGSN